MGNTSSTAAPELPSNLRRWTIQEIREHNENNGTNLIIIDNKVFDVTSFMLEHPGGDDVLKELKGQDATSGFLDVGHSEDAREQMMDYLVGLLDSSEGS